MIAAPGPIRTVLTSRIAGSTEVRLAGVAQDEASAVEKIVTDEADVAAIHIHLGGELAGLDVARNVSKASPRSGILVIVDGLSGVDVRRHARMFGVAWSYALADSIEEGHKFAEVVQSVARGIHWIDPHLRRVLEAIWRVADQGRDLEITDALDELSESAQELARRESPPEPEPRPRGIQTAQVGKGGIGSGGFGVRKAG